MTGKFLPSSPNWYCSRCSDGNESGYFVFSAKNIAIVLNVAVYPPIFEGIFSHHQERISSIVFSKSPQSANLLASASEDGIIKVWDVSTRLISHECSRQHQEKISCIDWSQVDKDLIISADIKGQVFSWNFKTDVITQARPQKGVIMCLACCPDDARLIALGYKDGNIAVADVSQNFNIVYRLKGHDDDVHCLNWAPTFDNEQIEKIIRKGYEGHLIASSSRDRTVRIWSAETGRVIYNHHLPNPVSYKNREHGYDELAKSRAWIPLKWIKSNLLLVGSRSGELLQCNILEKSKNCWRTFKHKQGKTHTRILFGISIVNENTVCTISMDRQIMFWKLSSLEHQYTLPTLGGFVYALSFSTVDPGRLAVGVGDNMIRIWNMNNAANAHDIITLWQGIKAKVTSLSWHPSKESWLAYGTEEGRIGIYDVFSNKPPLMSTTYHRGMVYTVTWGPLCSLSGVTSDVYQLFTCGGGLVFQHNPQNLNNPPVDLNHLIKTTNNLKNIFPQRTEICWKADKSVVAIGNEDGTIEIFRPPCLKLVSKLQIHHKLIQCVQWHPLYTASSTDPSSCQFLLASCSTESIIHVTDLQNILGNSLDEDKCVTITDSTYQFNKHRNRITKLSWSPHTDGKLASASYDGTSQIWDVLSNKPLANFRGHCGRLFSVAWSPLDINSVFTGSEDFCVYEWNILKQEFFVPPKADKKFQKKGKSKQQNKNEDNGIDNPSENGVFQELEVLLQQKRLELLNASKATDKTVLSSENSVTEIEDDKHGIEESNKTFQKQVVKDRSKKKKKSLFPESSGMENRGKSYLHEDIKTLAKFYCHTENVDQEQDLPSHLGLFGYRNSVYRFLKSEGDYHIKNGQSDLSLQFDFWKGNVEGMLQTASEEGQLHDWLVAVAPLASYEVWLKSCECFAQQLIKEGSYQKAVIYFLCCGKIYEAIEMLQNQGLFRDAITLAKLRLSPKDRLLKDLYINWANQLIKENNFEQAAKCYLAIKDPIAAAKLLTRRSDPLSLQMVAYLFQISGQKEDAIQYGRQCIREFVSRGDWVNAYQTTQDLNGLKEWNLVISTHELLIKDFLSCNACPAYLFENSNPSKYFETWVSSTVQKDDEVWTPHLVLGEAFFIYLSKLWTQNQWFSYETLSNDYVALKENQFRKNISSYNDMFFQCSFDLTLSLLAFQLDLTQKGISHLINVLYICHKQPNVLENMCQLILPFGPEDLELCLPVTCSLQSPVLKVADRDRSVSFSSGRFYQEIDYLFAYYSLAQLMHLYKISKKEIVLSKSNSSDSLSSILEQAKTVSQTVAVDLDIGLKSEFKNSDNKDCNDIILITKLTDEREKSDIDYKQCNDISENVELYSESEKGDHYCKQYNDLSEIIELSSASENDDNKCKQYNNDISENIEHPNESEKSNSNYKQSDDVSENIEFPSELEDKTCVALDEEKTLSKCSLSGIDITLLKTITRLLLWDVQAQKLSLQIRLSHIVNMIAIISIQTRENQSKFSSDSSKNHSTYDLSKKLILPAVGELVLENTQSNHLETQEKNEAINIAEERDSDLVGEINDNSPLEIHESPENIKNEMELAAYRNMLKYLDDLFQMVLTADHLPGICKPLSSGPAVEDLYSNSWITYEDLINEQQKIKHQLDLLNNTILDLPYPDVFDCASNLVEVCLKYKNMDNGVHELGKQVAHWALQHSISRQHLNHFKQYLTQFE